MHGSNYFQAKGIKRKPAALLDVPELNSSLIKGVQGDALRQLTPKDAARIGNLQRNVSDRFDSWRFKLRLGFSLLFYGYGSKKLILNDFGVQACKDGGVLSVNGWSHTLTLRGLLLKTLSMLRASGTHSTRATGDARSLVAAIKEGIGDQTLYIIINSIDASGLRSTESHGILSEVAAIPGIHLIASIDHVNAPLLWDKRAAANFNWAYQELTTFVPYASEIVSIQPLLCSASNESEKQGASVVLQTLVPNARHIFRLLAESQLESDEQSGMTVHELFKVCRERFLVTNELALRSHLNEFRDHQLVQTRRSAEGGESLVIPMADEQLEQLLIDLD